MMHSHHGSTSGFGSASSASLGLQSRDRLSPVQTLTAIDALVGAMQSERKLVDDLTQTMRRQRAAVAGDDLEGLDDSVFATHRLVQTLGEARRRRRGVCGLLGEPEDLGLHELDAALGSRMTGAVRDERDALQTSARALQREVDTNRRVLREALAQSDEYVRAICQPAAPSSVYGGDAAPAKAAGARLIDRQA